MCHDPLPVGGIAVGVMLGTYALLGVPVSAPLLVAAGCGAALIYGADRAVVAAPEDRWNRPDRVAWVRAHRRWLVAEGSVLAVVGAGALLFLRPATIGSAVFLAIIAVGHQGVDWNWEGRSTGLIKPVVIALVWAGGGTVLPMVEAQMIQGAAVAWLGAYRTLFVLPNVLLSDWGDRRGDRAAGRHPWTERARGGDVRWGATMCLLGALLLAGVGGTLGVPPELLVVDAVGPVLLLGSVWTLNPEESKHRLVLDLIVAWPAVTAAVAWGIG